eukprot:7378659-Prymnesium_polylepis.1
MNWITSETSTSGLAKFLEINSLCQRIVQSSDEPDAMVRRIEDKMGAKSTEFYLRGWDTSEFEQRDTEVKTTIYKLAVSFHMFGQISPLVRLASCTTASGQGNMGLQQRFISLFYERTPDVDAPPENEAAVEAAYEAFLAKKERVVSPIRSKFEILITAMRIVDTYIPPACARGAEIAYLRDAIADGDRAHDELRRLDRALARWQSSEETEIEEDAMRAKQAEGDALVLALDKSGLSAFILTTLGIGCDDHDGGGASQQSEPDSYVPPSATKRLPKPDDDEPGDWASVPDFDPQELCAIPSGQPKPKAAKKCEQAAVDPIPLQREKWERFSTTIYCKGQAHKPIAEAVTKYESRKPAPEAKFDEIYLSEVAGKCAQNVKALANAWDFVEMGAILLQKARLIYGSSTFEVSDERRHLGLIQTWMEWEYSADEWVYDVANKKAVRLVLPAAVDFAVRACDASFVTQYLTFCQASEVEPTRLNELMGKVEPL